MVLKIKKYLLGREHKHFNLHALVNSIKLDMSRILSMNEQYIKTINENDLYQCLVEYCNYKEEVQGDKETKVKSSLSF